MTVLALFSSIYDQFNNLIAENGILVKSVNLSIRMENSTLRTISMNWVNNDKEKICNNYDVIDVENIVLDLHKLWSIVENIFGPSVDICQFSILLDPRNCQTKIRANSNQNSRENFVKEIRIDNTRVIVQILFPLL